MKAVLLRTEVRDTLNRPVRDLRISVIDRCNLRCTYCMPLEEYGDRYQFLPDDELLSFDEIMRIVRLFVRVGVSKIRLTGGEPLLRKDLPELVRRLDGLEGVEDVALTTNGALLRKHARALREAGLSRVTVSLDSLDDDVLGQMNGRGLRSEVVLDGIEAAREAGFGSIKINAVVQKGVNDHTIPELLDYFRGRDCIVRLIEYMDVGNRNGWRSDHVVETTALIEEIRRRFPLTPLEPNYTGEVASRYAYEDGSGEVGFIASVTTPFCKSCMRARLSAEGKVYTCLFAGAGTDLRELLRAGVNDEKVLECISGLWTRRDDRYSELRASMSEWDQHRLKVEMYQIGG